MQQFISTYGYLAIFVLMLAESACIPIPSELTMPFAGAVAAGAVAGVHLNVILVIITGLAGNVAGSYLAWAVGLVGGQAVARRWSGYVFGSHGIDRAQRWFDRYGGRAVFFGRMLPVIRTFISLPAGFARMQWLRFGIYTTAGCLPWIAGLAWAGYAAGASWQSVASAMRGPTYVVVGIAVIVVMLGIVFALRVRHRRSSGSNGRRADHAFFDGRPRSAAQPEGAASEPAADGRSKSVRSGQK